MGKDLTAVAPRRQSIDLISSIGRVYRFRARATIHSAVTWSSWVAMGAAVRLVHNCGMTTGNQRAAWRGTTLEAVLFDLDGTLLDTAADISLALNRAIAEHGWAPVEAADTRTMIGQGGPVLVKRTAQLQRRSVDESTHAAIVERFFHHYGALQGTDESGARPFAGAAEGLRAVHELGLKTAIVTNKQQRFAIALAKRLGLAAWVDVYVGGDSCPKRKPDPMPLLFACESLGVMPARALMVGDSINDLTAARAAGIPIVCVPYGYNEGQDPRALPCDALIESIADLPALLLREAAAV
jgi:phosphoglycolate phosphatase